MTEVRITEHGALACPNCQANPSNSFTEQLHHDLVTVYERREDAEHVTVTQVLSGQITMKIVPSQGSGNPSSRRHGLTIRFWCELCDQISELTVEQHKGSTFLGWRATKVSAAL